MSIRKKLISNVSWNLAGSVTKLAISFFISILTARYLGPSNYGMLGYVVSISSFFTSLCNLGINAILVKELLEDHENQGVVLGSTFLPQMISTLICSIAFCGLIAILNPDEPIYLTLALIQSVYMVFNVSQGLNYWFQARLENKITAIASTIGYLAMAVYRIFLLATQKSVIWFAWATTFDIVIVGLIMVGCYQKRNGPKLRLSWEKSKSILSRGKHFILAGLMVSLYAQMDKVMLKSLIDSSSVGYYATANSLNSMWTFVIAAIIDSVSPVIYESYDADRARFNKQIKLLYAAIIWFCAIVGIVICLLANWGIHLLYGDDYAASVPVLRILAWSPLFSYLGVAKNIWIVKENKNKYLVAFTVIGVLGNTILNFLLIPLWGPVGAAIATVITQFISSVLAQLVFKETRPCGKMILEALTLRNVLSKDDVHNIMSFLKHREK